MKETKRLLIFLKFKDNQLSIYVLFHIFTLLIKSVWKKKKKNRKKIKKKRRTNHLINHFIICRLGICTKEMGKKMKSKTNVTFT